MNDRKDEGFEARAVAIARTGAPAAVIVGTAAASYVAGPSLGVLVLGGSALVGAIAALWTSVRALVGETPLAPEDAFALGAPSSEEEQKRAVLRAIKDIEFERAVGKITDEDFRVLLARYRGEAKRLLRRIDESRAPERARAEALAAKHLLAGERASADATRDDEAEHDAGSVGAEAAPVQAKPKHGKRAAGRDARNARRDREPTRAANDGALPDSREGKVGPACGACETINDADAVFCKSCGARLTTETAAEPEAPRDTRGEEGAS